MKELLLFIIFYTFFILCKQSNIYIKRANYCEPIQTSISRILYQEQNGDTYEDIYLENYGFNPQYCAFKLEESDSKCCYIHLFYNNTNYDFCSKIEMKLLENETETDFIESVFSNEIDIIYNNINRKEIEKNISIDCFSQQPIFIHCFILLTLIFLF